MILNHFIYEPQNNTSALSTETMWCIYASVNGTIFGSGNGLALVQAIILNNADLLLLSTFRTNYSDIIKSPKFP